MPDIGQRVLRSDDKLKALIVTGHTDIHHDWRTISPMLRDLLKETGLFDVRITEEFRGASAETLDEYDLVVLNYFGRFEPWSRAPEKRWGTSAEQALYDFVAAGKGVVVYHASLQMGAGWEDDFEAMAGGVMREHCSRRAPIDDFRLHVVAPDHAITAGMPEFMPHYDDDLYVNLQWAPGADVEVLVTGWDNPLRYTQVPEQWNALPGHGGGARPGLDQPLRRRPGVRQRHRARPRRGLAPVVPRPVRPRLRVGGHRQGHARAARGVRGARARRRLVADDPRTDGAGHVRAAKGGAL